MFRPKPVEQKGLKTESDIEKSNRLVFLSNSNKFLHDSQKDFITFSVVIEIGEHLRAKLNGPLFYKLPFIRSSVEVDIILFHGVGYSDWFITICVFHDACKHRMGNDVILCTFLSNDFSPCLVGLLIIDRNGDCRSFSGSLMFHKVAIKSIVGFWMD